MMVVNLHALVPAVTPELPAQLVRFQIGRSGAPTPNLVRNGSKYPGSGANGKEQHQNLTKLLDGNLN
jgi:hypothetical protein